MNPEWDPPKSNTALECADHSLMIAVDLVFVVSMSRTRPSSSATPSMLPCRRSVLNFATNGGTWKVGVRWDYYYSLLHQSFHKNSGKFGDKLGSAAKWGCFLLLIVLVIWLIWRECDIIMISFLLSNLIREFDPPGPSRSYLDLIQIQPKPKVAKN